MAAIHDFQRLSDFEWELPSSFRKDMRVPVRIFASAGIIEQALSDLSVEQAINAATLPGLLGSVLVMPDMHQGYGFPIGGVAATSAADGVISPGGIGYDINCGVRLLSTSIPFEAAKPRLRDLAAALNAHCPSGVGRAGSISLTENELKKVCEDGSNWAVKNGYASRDEVQKTEGSGCLAGADFSKVSARAIQRGKPQLGTLGSGNHFIEVGIVDEIFDEEAAALFGLLPGKLTVMIHCGSRGLGHQICSDYVQVFQKVVADYGIELPDRELVCAPLESAEGKDYVAAMRAAANYAFCNRQVLANLAGRAFEQVFAGVVKDWHLNQIYDIAHNIAKMETHTVNGKEERVCVHRKGATRAFGPGQADLPDIYRRIGQPVFVPGSMGTASWVLLGTETSMEKSFGSCCHGAGRVMSRQKAKKTIHGGQLIRELGQQGIEVMAGSVAGLAEEAPAAYKDVDEVIRVVSGAGLARKVAEIKPVVVVKG